MAGDPFAAAGKPEPFGGRGLDIHPARSDLAVTGDIFNHRGDMRRQFRPLADDRRVQVIDPVALLLCLGDHLAQQRAVGLLAKRIEDLNKQYPEYDVLISDETCRALGARQVEFDLYDLGEIPIRGKAQPVRVWAVAQRRLETTRRI